MITFWKRAQAFPPILVRLLAKHKQHGYGGKPLTDAEIADASGLTQIQVAAISQGTNWTGIDLPTMRQFLTGCRLDFCDRVAMKRATEYCRVQARLAKQNRTTWTYLRISPLWKTLYAPMIQRYRQSLAPSKS